MGLRPTNRDENRRGFRRRVGFLTVVLSSNDANTQSPRPSQPAERGFVSPGGEVRPTQGGSRSLVRRKHPDFHTAILGVRRTIVSLVDWSFLAQPDHMNAVDRNVVFGYQVFGDTVGAPAAQLF